MAEEKKTSKKAEKAEKSKDTKKKSKKNPFKSIASFFKSVKSEGKKVVWAKPKEVLRNTIIVLIVCAIVGVCIYGVDSLLSLGMKGIKGAADKESTSVSQDVDDTADDDTAADTDEETTAEAAE
ncbi:MAG: preprotein translocase subunit SecE [Clostridium sp.]|nr:preprotein translocase subunit SecE [Clostridium sp.]